MADYTKEEGLRLFKAGQLDEAIEALEQVRDKDPDNAQIHSILGAVFNQKGDRLQSIFEFEEALRLDESARSYFNLGMVYEQAHRIDEAVRQYRMANELDPSYAPATSAIARMKDMFAAEHAPAVAGDEGVGEAHPVEEAAEPAYSEEYAEAAASEDDLIQPPAEPYGAEAFGAEASEPAMPMGAGAADDMFGSAEPMGVSAEDLYGAAAPVEEDVISAPEEAYAESGYDNFEPATPMGPGEPVEETAGVAEIFGPAEPSELGELSAEPAAIEEEPAAPEPADIFGSQDYAATGNLFDEPAHEQPVAEEGASAEDIFGPAETVDEPEIAVEEEPVAFETPFDSLAQDEDVPAAALDDFEEATELEAAEAAEDMFGTAVEEPAQPSLDDALNDFYSAPVEEPVVEEPAAEESPFESFEQPAEPVADDIFAPQADEEFAPAAEAFVPFDEDTDTAVVEEPAVEDEPYAEPETDDAVSDANAGDADNPFGAGAEVIEVPVDTFDEEPAEEEEAAVAEALGEFVDDEPVAQSFEDVMSAKFEETGYGNDKAEETPADGDFAPPVREERASEPPRRAASETIDAEAAAGAPVFDAVGTGAERAESPSSKYKKGKEPLEFDEQISGGGGGRRRPNIVMSLLSGLIVGAVLFAIINVVSQFMMTQKTDFFAEPLNMVMNILIWAGVGAAYGSLIGLWVGRTGGGHSAGLQAGALVGALMGAGLGFWKEAEIWAIAAIAVIFAFVSALVGMFIGRLVDTSAGR